MTFAFVCNAVLTNTKSSNVNGHHDVFEWKMIAYIYRHEFWLKHSIQRIENEQMCASHKLIHLRQPKRSSNECGLHGHKGL